MDARDNLNTPQAVDLLCKVHLELGRTMAAIDGFKADAIELRNFVNEQLTVNYADLAERLKSLEESRVARRAGWKTITMIGSVGAGAATAVRFVFDWYTKVKP